MSASLTGSVEYLGVMGEESLVQEMSHDKPYIEAARKFLGAVIALGLLVFYRHLLNRYHTDAV